jgi:hypothetical protein
MFRVTLTYADGRALSRLVYADNARDAVKIALRGRFISSGANAHSSPSNIVDARAYDQVLQMHSIAARVLSNVDSQRHGAN